MMNQKSKLSGEISKIRIAEVLAASESMKSNDVKEIMALSGPKNELLLFASEKLARPKETQGEN